MHDMERFRVRCAPATVYYIPNFISEDEAGHIWRKVYAAPKSKWTQLSNRRLQNWGGLPQPQGMIPQPLPNWLADISNRVSCLAPGLFGGNLPNHVLVNEYNSGQGIMPHLDGPLYSPTVSTLSLGSHALLDFFQPVLDDSSADSADLKSRYMLSIFLEPNSLLLLEDDMYKKYLHGIRETSEDVISEDVCNVKQLGVQRTVGTTIQRSTRVSLTIRNVPKTFKLKLNIGQK